MGEAIGQTLPFAVAVALSPVPIIAIVLILGTPRARTNGLAFLLGWVFGLAAVGTVVLLATSGTDTTEDDGPAAWVSWVKLALGVLMLLIAGRSWRGRPREGQPATMPGWMAALDTFTAPKSAGTAILLSAVNPKNLVLTLGAAAAIVETGIPAGEEFVALAVFVLVGALGIAVPVVIYVFMGARADELLSGLKEWLGEHNAAIMAAVCLVIGAKLIGDAISGLAG
ncbi:MAG TPA: GAP family protein [Jiangellaceae bacterium]